jgi:serine protease
VVDAAKGVMWVADNGADVINMSFGASSDSITMKNAIDYAYNKGITLVAAV